MKARICLLLAVCLLLCGCDSLMGGYYYSVKPHQELDIQIESGNAAASNYQQLCAVLEGIVESGIENAVIQVADYDQSLVEQGMNMAVSHIYNVFPIGAYAVESINYEIGLSGGVPAVSVEISYLHGRAELRKILHLQDMNEVPNAIGTALANCEGEIVLLIDRYEQMDMTQLVLDFADENPDIVMEIPQTAIGVYPDNGEARVVEVHFTYQTSRDSLRQMQSQVQPVFSAATLYVSGDGSDLQKYYQLYAFLMERYDYTIETSITPAYSLLRHGVGDSKAFAVVYSAMCRQAGLECLVITGTHEGEPWYWNLIFDNGYYYHVDLLRSSNAGRFMELTDAQMHGYVWDYSEYPKAIGIPTMPENPNETLPGETPPEETPPTETTPEETPPTETTPEETLPEETLPEETIPEETIPPTEPTVPPSESVDGV
ncbi:MAG: transglutaminase domain-containing protein [Oscillospiraceae bacterium]|nr:transglutaminase domain-containing protein [Oscillospiraceae bacterium]